jgi:hypothetical protein
MSIWNYVFDTGIKKRTDIDALRVRLDRSATVGQMRVRQTATRIKDLENELAEAALLLRSLYVYLKEQPDFDAKRFAAILDQIDTADGTKDGKVTKRKKS